MPITDISEISTTSRRNKYAEAKMVSQLTAITSKDLPFVIPVDFTLL